jgi:hypothetical protein
MYEFVQVPGNWYRVCMVCGAMVLHEPTHTAWHEAAPAQPVEHTRVDEGEQSR